MSLVLATAIVVSCSGQTIFCFSLVFDIPPRVLRSALCFPRGDSTAPLAELREKGGGGVCSPINWVHRIYIYRYMNAIAFCIANLSHYINYAGAGMSTHLSVLFHTYISTNFPVSSHRSIAPEPQSSSPPHPRRHGTCFASNARWCQKLSNTSPVVSFRIKLVPISPINTLV